MSEYDWGGEDTSQAEDRFSPLPKGWYLAEIVSIEARRSKAGQGHLGVSAEWVILGPTHVGRRIFAWFNLGHPKPMVRDIAREQWLLLSRACGLRTSPSREELERLVRIPHEIRVGVQRDDPERNEVKSWRAAKAGAASAVGAVPDDEIPF